MAANSPLPVGWTKMSVSVLCTTVFGMFCVVWILRVFRKSVYMERK